MTRTLRIAARQAAPLPIGDDLASFEREVRAVAPHADLIVYPELHLFGSDTWPDAERNSRLRASAVPIDGELMTRLAEVARGAGVWLIPGSICERGPKGELFNTAVVFSPTGELVARYRKVFPWRPSEPYDPGDRFVTFDLDGVGRIGLSICYDAWFPEVSRHLAWMGADVVVNIVKTTTPDREQEVVLTRANSIANQTFTVSVNCAGPVGRGMSLVVDPEGSVIDATDDAQATVLLDALDLDRVQFVREHGTAGCVRMWSHFLPTDAAVELPLYAGRIDPERWRPHTSSATPTTANPLD